MEENQESGFVCFFLLIKLHLFKNFISNGCKTCQLSGVALMELVNVTNLDDRRKTKLLQILLIEEVL